jgi:AcrR family transcriptional regulator
MVRLERSEWLRAARLALLRHGASGVRVEPLAKSLGVTKGSFYWHFKDRAALLEALLREWEQEKSLLSELVGRADRRGALDAFFGELARRVRVSERGEWPSDAAIFAWAGVSPAVAKRADREERARIRLLQQLYDDDDLGEFVYMAYLGFLLRRRRVTGAARSYPVLARVAKTLTSTRTKPRRERGARR